MIIKSTPLELPDANSDILVFTDTSEKGIAGLIWKDLTPSEPGTCLSKRHVAPILFYSRIATPAQQHWSTMQKELFAIVMTLNQPNVSSFLQTKHLTLFCDHKHLSGVHVDRPSNNWDDKPEKKKRKTKILKQISKGKIFAFHFMKTTEDIIILKNTKAYPLVFEKLPL
ncbi:hypothetical protein P9112_006457 [Eukaryota sp. TZLM1-RC]